MLRFKVIAEGVRFQSASRKSKPDPRFPGKYNLGFTVQAVDHEAAGQKVEDYLVGEDLIFESTLITQMLDG